MSGWKPIENLPVDWKSMSHESLHALAVIWKEQKKRLENTKSYNLFIEKMRRKLAIETGVIERLYTIDRGVTHILIEHGIDVALIPHGKTDKPASEIIAMIRDHENAIERVFDYVGANRNLSTSFIKALHQLLTRNQPYTVAVDKDGNSGQVELIQGDWKKFPNNPTRLDGTVFEYCPPEQVASQMDQLIEWHLQHYSDGVSPEVEAAWLHHRFTQIHPFQDGNGRVARNLATLVFLRSDWFPLVVLDDQDENNARTNYIDALEKADDGDLKPLVDFFAISQRKSFVSSFSLVEESIAEASSYQVVLNSVVERIKNRQTLALEIAITKVETYADELFVFAEKRLKDVERDINTALYRLNEKSSIKTDSAKSTDDRSGYYRFQIIGTAKLLNYYANLRGYKTWLRLSIRLYDVQTELLISFHPLGYEPKGVMVCSACAYRRLSSDDNDTTSIQNLQQLTSLPFDFTYQEDIESLKSRFDKWIEEVILVGLDYWRKGI